MEIMTMLLAFVATLGEGLGYSYIVFKKSVQNEGDTFNPAKAGRTIVISIGMGLLAALIAGLTGWSLQDVIAWGTTTGLFSWFTVVIDQGYSYLIGPKGKADREKLKEEIKEDLEKAVPIIEKASKKKPKAKEEETTASAEDKKVEDKTAVVKDDKKVVDDKVVPKGKDEK